MTFDPIAIREADVILTAIELDSKRRLLELVLILNEFHLHPYIYLPSNACDIWMNIRMACREI